jgi:hypothetical protein
MPGVIHSIAWITTVNANFLVTGCNDGQVQKWQVVKEGELCSVRLVWKTTNGTLAVAGASIQDVRGLAPFNKHLMNQRGSIGEPEHLLRETSKNMQPSNEMTLDTPSTAESPEEQPEQSSQREQPVQVTQDS